MFSRRVGMVLDYFLLWFLADLSDQVLIFFHLYTFQVADANQKRKKGVFGAKGGDKEVKY